MEPATRLMVSSLVAGQILDSANIEENRADLPVGTPRSTDSGDAVRSVVSTGPSPVGAGSPPAQGCLNLKLVQTNESLFCCVRVLRQQQ
jgi:hypothetical protein